MNISRAYIYIGHLLHPILLPGRAGCGCYYQRSSLNSTGYSSNRSCRCCGCVGDQNWTLCKTLSLERPLFRFTQTTQVPFMIMGGCMGIVGTVLLTRIGIGTPTALWVTYLVVAGFGLGMGVQVPFTALQVVLR